MSTSSNKPLKLEVSQEADSAVVKISGAASMSEANRLRETLEQLAAEQVRVIVLDMREMDFICSLGLGAIINGHLKSRHHQGQIKLVGPVPPVRELLETTRLTKLFGIYDTVEQALAAS